MSNERNDGGPAFPVYNDGQDGVEGVCLGMTLRDWFATHAAEKDIVEHRFAFEKEHGFWPTRSQARYQHADTMLAARKARP